jgi:broad specificity phosphatase PhoE
VTLALDANLQEFADLPCNTGSPLTELENEFPELKPQIRTLDENWYIKTGPTSPLPADAQRKIEIMALLDQNLRALQSDQHVKDVIVVTHQGVIALLAPSANIPVAQWQTFSLVRNASGELSLV